MNHQKLACALVILIVSLLSGSQLRAQAVSKQDVLSFLENDRKAQESRDADAVCNNIGKDALLKIVVDISTGRQVVSLNREHYRMNLKKMYPLLRENRIQRKDVRITISPDGSKAVATYAIVQTVTTYLRAQGDYGASGSVQAYERATMGREDGKLVFLTIEDSLQQPFSN
jgi:hypothetical protein